MAVVVDGLETDVPWGLILVLAFTDPDAKIISESPTEVVIRYKGPGGVRFDIVFFGTDLKIDLAGDDFGGKIENIEINRVKNPIMATMVTLPVATDPGEFNDVIDALPGDPGIKSIKKLDPVFQPPDSPFPNTDYTGSDGPNIARGFNGDDNISTGGGRDTLIATKGDDTYDAGKGKDTFDASFLKGPVTIDLKAGKATRKGDEATLKSVENAIGTKQNDTIKGDNKKNVLVGNGGNDTIKGKGGNDKLAGDGGNDSIDGGDGKDKIKGGNGNDTIDGGPGRDTIEGGRGDDTMTGGKDDGEKDVFVFNGKKGAKGGNDTINDWEEGTDIIRFKGVKKADVKVTNKDGNTIIDYSEGTIELNDVELNKGEIDFQFL